MKPSLFTIAAVVLLLGRAPAPAADQPGPIPGLPWVHEGTLVTYKQYTVELVGPFGDFKPNEHGGWVGPDGKIYHTPDAGGLIQTSVVCIDGDNVILKTIRFTSEFQITGADPARTLPRKGGEIRFQANSRDNNIYKAPELIGHEATDMNAGKIVNNVTWPEGKQMVEAVRIDKMTKLEHLVVVYDKKTGLGLHLSSLTDEQNGKAILMLYDFVDVRDLHVPWNGEALPQAVRNMKSLHLAGNLTVRAGFGAPPSAVTLEYSMDHCTDHWALIDSIATLQAGRMPQPIPDKKEQGYYGSCEFGGLWIGPASIKNLQQGQVLDDDPITKMKTTVSRLDDNAVSITQSNSATTVQHTYDRATGLLVEYQWYDALTRSTTALRRDQLQ